jgi:hypothetical protein
VNPKYQLLSQQGKVFQVSGAQAGTTIAAGHVAPPAAGAATLLSILNPLESKVDLEVIQASIGHISGTPGAGTFTYCMAYQGEAVTAAEAVAVKRCLRLSSKTTVAKAWSATTLTGSVVHLVNSHFPSAPFAGAIAATTEATGFSQVHDVDGAIIIPPGWMLTIAPAATGTTHIVAVSITFAEVASGNN